MTQISYQEPAPTYTWVVWYKEKPTGIMKRVRVTACYARHEGDTISFWDTHGNLIEAYGRVVRVNRE